TTDRVQRLRLVQSGLATLLMALSVGVMQYVVRIAHAPHFWVIVWDVLSLGGLLLIYVLIRSGFSQRFEDPSMTLPQMVFGITSGATGYMLAGPARGAVFPILSVILLFGMFQLRASVALWISSFALCLFGMVMYLMSHIDPLGYPYEVEIAHFMLLAFTLPAISVLSARLSRIRQRLSTQKTALAEALARVEELATRDELTGLLNRRHMQTLLDQEVQRSLRQHETFCLALLDIDHFKRINDSHGHAAGDAVLRAFADAGRASIRTSDVLARWGGEEFVLLLAATRMPPAAAGVERLRAAVAALRVATPEGELQLTVSAGLTEFKLGETLAQALERADKLLFQAKAGGRNRVITG
ncbi:MAG TPA: diguanylate cyclase, partial [Burkholderiaceae bacterium]